MLPREFFIEDRLEKYRLQVDCNLGESGMRNLSLKELLSFLNLSSEELLEISLGDSPNQGSYELRKEIACLYEGVEPDEVVVTTGTSEALYLFFHLILNKNDKVALFTPAFQALYEIPIMLGAEIVQHEVDVVFNFKNFFNPENKLVIINHPHNPTGVSLSNEDILTIKSQSKNFSNYILFDEHYRFLDLSNDLGFSGAKLTPNTFATGSITKCFGVTGLRIGWIVGNVDFMQKLRSFKDYLTHTVNPISEYLALKILQNKNKLLMNSKDTILQNLSYFCEKVHLIPSIENFHVPSGGLVFFPKLKNGISSEKYADELLKQCNLFVLPGTNFEREGYIRIGLGENKKRFKQGIDRWCLLSQCF